MLIMSWMHVVTRGIDCLQKQEELNQLQLVNGH